MNSNQLLKTLKDTGAMLSGHFLLTSGRHSNVYLEKFRILEDPCILDLISKDMASLVENKSIDLVLGAAIGGILIAGGVGRHLKVKHIFSERMDGEMVLKRGFVINKHSRIVIVDDIITTGGSIFELIKLAEQNGAVIKKIISIVDRSSNRINFEYPSASLLHLPSKSWNLDNCPLCKDGIPLRERGRTGKRLIN